MKYTFLFVSVVSLFIHSPLCAETFYICRNGNNTFDGRSPETAWQTIAKVNSMIFSAGDSILFRAGDFWREELRISETGTAEQWLYYGRYGDGSNPQILGSEAARSWSAAGAANIWQAAGSFTNYGVEYYGGNIFFCADDSVCWGNYQDSTDLSRLTKNYDWTIKNRTLYVFCSGDPNILYDSVEVTQRERCVSTTYNTSPVNYLELNGIDMHYGRRQGFFSGYPAVRGATHMVFRNLEVSYIGERGSGSAYGLAIWHSNTLVEQCRFSDCGRRAVSYNLYENTAPPNNRVLENLIVRNNIFKRGWHTTSLDYSALPTEYDTLKNCYFYNNVIDDSDHDTLILTSNGLFTQNGRGTASCVDSVFIVGNVFTYNTANAILTEGGTSAFVWNNTIIGINHCRRTNPWSSVCFNGTDSADYRNNILVDDFPDPGNAYEYYGVLINPGNDAAFSKKDYNLYYTLYPNTERCFSGHRINSIPANGMGYWDTGEWQSYKEVNTSFEQHSPEPGDPGFVDAAAFDFRLSAASPARGAGVALPDIIVTDPFGVVDHITRHDITGAPRSMTNPSIGAYEFIDPNSVSSREGRPDRAELYQNYPNPFNPLTIIKFHLPQRAMVTLNVSNILGQHVAAIINEMMEAGEHEAVFDAHLIASGVYFYRMTAGRFSFVKKMILLK